ncbi:MAG: YbaK/EbsC family protein [Tannerella sp.]|jgi:prolyl-tRNA editing enzyme YbaK/EbsC (Cys-tRNA(Pro) deacylase)|nr:YbaK/EbsC family protein [Tannerella sp.]
MFTLHELAQYLSNNMINYEIIPHDKPIISKMDATDLFDVNKAAPTFILKTEVHLFAFILSPKRERINFKLLKEALGCAKLSFADEKEVLDATGYEIGRIPLVGHDLPYVLDSQLFDFDFIYGGTGDPYHTLKISPNDLLRLNNNSKTICFS